MLAIAAAKRSRLYCSFECDFWIPQHQAVLQNAIAEIEMQREEMEEEQRMEALLLQDAAVVTVEPDWDRRTPLALHSPMVRSHPPHAEGT